MNPTLKLWYIGSTSAGKLKFRKARLVWSRVDDFSSAAAAAGLPRVFLRLELELDTGKVLVTDAVARLEHPALNPSLGLSLIHI